ncbi:MAG: aspartate aminotransferase family protein [Deltaproteobacteria bacterium]|jgi:acetylornithine aminotransferase|nr:aspartate aminotransferase family protein [Deltaproteobacteria bacterium]MBW2468099.1 aspartate aminotransferase family protein [Deltaproteobacteria bacterium]
MTAALMRRADRVMAATYQRFAIAIEKGKGCQLWDTEERSYTDFVAGIAVCNLGHAHPRISAVLSRQAETLLHVSNLYYTLPQVDLAAWLVDNSFADRVFFGNSGAEANEAAIKLARKYFKDRGEPDRFQIITMERSFHGRTMATLSATGQEKIKKGFDPVLPGFDFVPFNDIGALRDCIGGATCAVMLEPIQGEGGVRCPDEDYLRTVRQICDDTGALLIFDEIQTGMGRTGKLFAYQHFGIEPDIMTLAKALANGLPIGAMLARESVAGAFGPGAHASTFGGTPIVTAAAMEVCKILTEEGVIEKGRAAGAYFKEQLLALKDRHALIEDVRGRGLLLGMKLKIDGAPIVRQCMQAGFLINCIQDRILRFIPPLIIAREEIDRLIACLDNIFADM